MDTEEVRGSRWYHALVGVGLVSYGVVHLLLAWIAVRIATGGRGDASSEGAMQEIAAQPAGKAPLWVMALGLIGLVLWQVLAAIVGPDGSASAPRLTRRLSSIGRAVVYLTLTAIAVRVALGSGSASGQAEETLSARLMALPVGQFLVAAVGLGVIAVGVSEVVKGVRRSFVSRDLRGSAPRLVTLLGSAGWIAKGITLGAIGGLFVLAAVNYDPEKAGGMDQALTAVRHQPFGPALLVMIAVGLAAFGVYCFFWARHAKY